MKTNLNGRAKRLSWNFFKCKKVAILRKLPFNLVRAGRLELPHLAALDPKSSVSTNSTTPALSLNWIANIQLFLK